MKIYKIILIIAISLNIVRFNGITDEKIIGMNTLLILIYIFIKKEVL